MNDISVLILTHNEEKNMRKCIESILPLADRIFVVESNSEDSTVGICKEHGVTVAMRPFATHADQFNSGLDHFDFVTEWVMRMDADEELTSGLVGVLTEFLVSPDDEVTGVCIQRRVHFMGRWIRYSGYYPAWLMRVFRNGVDRCVAHRMDKHIVLSRGRSIEIKEDIIDKSNKDLAFWIAKHNKYASIGMLDIMQKRHSSEEGAIESGLTGSQASSKRWVNKNVYSRMPLFLRPFLYFIYRYFLRHGILDGKEGMILHFLRGFWYRFLVDAELYVQIRNEQGT